MKNADLLGLTPLNDGFYEKREGEGATSLGQALRAALRTDRNSP